MSFEVKLPIVTAMAVLIGNLASDWKGRSSVLWGVLTGCLGALYTPLALLMVLVIACAPKVKTAEPAVPLTDDASGAPQA